MAINKTFVAHTELKAQDLNDLVSQANGYVAETKTELNGNIAAAKTELLTIYDISVAHTVNNVPAQYESLSEALGTNGANIPQDIRRGGMSIKFIQSSHNKYVQYRLMANTFSTTISDWQGIVNEPVFGDNNIVTSDGINKASFCKSYMGHGSIEIYDSVLNLSPNRKYRIHLPITNWDVTGIDDVKVVLGIYSNLSGVRTQIYRTMKVDMPLQSFYDFETPTTFDSIDFLVRAAEGVIVRLVIEDVSDKLFVTEQSLSDEQKSIARNNIGAASVDTTEELTDSITNIYDLINGSNGNYIPQKALLPISGELTDDEDCIVTDKIPVSEGDAVTWNVGVVSGVKEVWLVEYDAQNSPIDKWRNSTSPRTITISHPETAYVRATFLFNSRYDSKVYVNNIREWYAVDPVNGINEEINGINEEIESLEDTLFFQRFEENSTTLVQGTIYNGQLGPATNNVSDAIYHRVNEGTVIKVSAQEYQIRYTYYNANKEYISKIGYETIYEITIPNNVSYVRFSFKKSDGSDFTPSDVLDGDISISISQNNIDTINESIQNLGERVANIEKAPDIVKRNSDKESMLVTSCRYRFKNETFKDLQLCICTDVHGDNVAMTNAVLATNGFDTIDALVCLGDQEPGNFANGWYNSFNTIIANCTKPVFTIAGNHDCGNSKNISICATHEQIYNAYIKFMVDDNYLAQSEITSGLNYYYHDFPSHNIRLICLYEYDDNLDINPNNNTEYKIQRGVRVIRQTQAQWFLNTLLSTPANYSVIVATHNPFSNNTTNQTQFRFADKTATTGATEAQNLMATDFIANAVEAFKNGTYYSEKIVFKGDAAYLNTINDGNIDYAYEVSADFSNKNTGANFLVYIGGHVHGDIVWKHNTYSQYQISPICAKTAMSGFKSDLMRTSTDGLCKDALTIISFDSENKKVRLVKIGANIVQNGDKRDFEVIDLL